MSDIKASYGDGSGALRLLVEQSDGTYAERVAVSNLPALSATGLVPVDTLAATGVARQLAAGASSANTALTTTCRRISMFARGADIRYVIGTGAQTANASTSHWIGQGERLDLDVPASANIAVIRAGSTDGTLEVSELTQ